MNLADSDRPSSSRYRNKDTLNERRPRSNMRDRDRDVEKASELTWLTYETKLRNLMQELLQPTIKRSREDRELYDTLMHKCETLTHRVEDLETITHKAEVKQTIFDDIFKRINNIDTQRKNDYFDVLDRIKRIENNMSTIGFDYDHLRESIKSIQDVTQKLSENFSNTTIQLDEYKKSYSNLVADLQKTISQHAEFQKSEQIKIEEKLQVIDNSILDLRTKTGSHELTLHATSNTLNDILGKVAIFERDVNESNASIINFAKHIDSIKSLKTKVETVEIRSRTIENYLEKYLPIFTQSQISESLHHCLPSTNKRKLSVYEEKRFKEMNSEILHDDGNPDLQKRIQSMYVILETTVKRYARAMAANTLGIKQRESEVRQTESSASRIIKTGKNTINNEIKTTERNRYLASDGEKYEIAVHEDKTNKAKKGVDLQNDGTYLVPTNQDDLDASSSRRGSANLEIERKESNRDEAVRGIVSYHQLQIPVKTNDKDTKTSEDPGTMGGLGEDESDVGSDLDEFQSRQIKKLQEEVVWIKENHPMNLRKAFEELNEKLSRVANNQLEISENATMNVKAAKVELEKYIRDRQKEELDKVNELDILYDSVKKTNEAQDKTYQFLRKLNDIIIPLIETVNGLLVVSLKEEKEKKTFIGLLQSLLLQNPQTQPPTYIATRTSEEAIRKKKETETSKRIGDLPYLAGVKVGSQIEEKPDFQEFEVKLRYNDRLVKKVEFLELTFDAFKGCLTYSSKFRVASNFAQFYEGESAKIANTPRKASLKPVRGGPHLLYEEKGNDIPVSANLKSLHSKISHVGYKNYVSEGVGVKMLDKKRSPAGLIKEREEYGVNRSFY